MFLLHHYGTILLDEVLGARGTRLLDLLSGDVLRAVRQSSAAGMV